MTFRPASSLQNWWHWNAYSKNTQTSLCILHIHYSIAYPSDHLWQFHCYEGSLYSSGVGCAHSEYTTHKFRSSITNVHTKYGLHTCTHQLKVCTYTPTSLTSSGRMDGKRSLGSPYMRWCVYLGHACLMNTVTQMLGLRTIHQLLYTNICMPNEQTHLILSQKPWYSWSVP